MPNHRAWGREPLHCIIFMKANIYVKIPLSALNIHGVTVSCVYSCAAGCSTGAECNSAKHKLRKSGVCKMCLFCEAGPRGMDTGVRSWEQLGNTRMLGCVIGLFTPHLRDVELSCTTFPKGDAKRSFQGLNLLFLATLHLQL